MLHSNLQYGHQTLARQFASTLFVATRFVDANGQERLLLNCRALRPEGMGTEQFASLTFSSQVSRPGASPIWLSFWDEGLVRAVNPPPTTLDVLEALDAVTAMRSDRYAGRAFVVKLAVHRMRERIEGLGYPGLEGLADLLAKTERQLARLVLMKELPGVIRP